MELGIVSNCWRKQLAAGSDLAELVEHAVARGYRAIELRQGCLGRYEQGAQHLPDPLVLAELPRRFPDVRFNLALAVPFFDQRTSPDNPLLLAGIAGAQALAGDRRPPHLRLVDVATVDAADDAAEALGGRWAALARAVATGVGGLSLENGRQSWGVFIAAFRAARRILGAEAARLRLCYDAVNLLNAADRPDPRQVVRSLSAADLAMVHLKQARQGHATTAVCSGDIDWPDHLGVLHEVGYRGPYLFEIPPDEHVDEHLAESREFIEPLM
jgi:sugar phosphate isomerase/epimerase